MQRCTQRKNSNKRKWTRHFQTSKNVLFSLVSALGEGSEGQGAKTSLVFFKQKFYYILYK